MLGINTLRGVDGQVADYFADQLQSGVQARATAARLAQEEALKGLQGRSAQSLGDEVADVYGQLYRGRVMGGEGSRDERVARDAAIRTILDSVGAVPKGVQGPAMATSAEVYGKLDPQQQAQILEYLARIKGPGMEARALDALNATRGALADKTWKGGLARTGLVSGGVAGTTAGAQGILALIDYLQGNGEEPVA
jgi:hypothetical protein